MKRHLSSVSGALVGLASINTHIYASAATYHTLHSDDLPPANAAAARPAPLKGFLTSPEWHTGGYANPQYYNDPESTMEFYYIGLSDVMTGMTNFPGFDTVVEPRIAAAASRGKHAILRFYMDYPRPAGSYVSHTPQFLIDDYDLQMTQWTSVDLNAVGSSPDYSDENLKTALANFAAALGNRYDGDSRVGYIQVGLLGFWGEWHTWTENSATHSWIPDATKTALIDAFDAAFETTQIQIRYPHWYAVGANQRQGLGLHDDSFAHSTIDEGVYGAPVDWFFWSQVQASAATDFWMSGAMGGEVRPELQATIFDDSYAAGTQYKQDFGQCAETTHATYMLNYHAFEESYSGNARDSARAASDQMGYAFRLAEVSVAEGSDGDTVDITATVIQDGIAPFYYDLSIELSCPDGFSGTVGGVDDIVSEGSTAAFTFTAVPATSTCLSSLGFSLSSSYALAGAPVKFAQGMSDGGVVEASLPLPPTALPTSQPTNVVTPSPTKAPTPLPTFSPTMPPTPVPTSPPSSLPTPLPTAMPTYASAATYHTLHSNDLPPANAAAARPAPLKGFLTSPEWHTGGYANPQYYNDPESTMEFYYIGLSDVMTGMTNFPGFDTVVEPRIAAAASRGKHAILRFYMDYPRPAGSYVSHTPQFLIDDYDLQMTQWTSVDLNAVGSSPDYSDENLKTALANFAAALGNRYDGDSRVGYIQVGLLGFWGEWHTWTENSATHSWIPDATKTALIDAFDAAFETTQIQIRYPHWYAVGANQRQGLGLHDDSFAHSTIDEGVYGAPVDWFFWSQVQASAATDFWMSGAMGGEVRPELQATIFDDSYAAGTQYKQDFGQCAETTHATYMLNYHAFEESYSGNARDSARAASDQMGYAFRLAEVSVAEGSDGDTVDITATVIQDGIAPFYYDLSIELSCPDGFSGTVGGVDDIVSEGSTAAFTFTAVPATSTCLSSLGFSLSSSYALAGAPVKFAQGMSDGGVVEASLPLPPTALPTSQPTNVVTPSPTKAPTPLPTFSPTMPPTPVPTSPPSSLPTPLPTAMPTYASAATYHTLHSNDLPPANAAAARPAPLKGFLTSPEWHTGGYANPQYYNDPESTMEFYYIGLSDVMTGMTNFPGFDTVVEPRIAAAASRGKHAILRFYMDYPRPAGSYVSHTPQFLIDDYDLQMTQWTSVDLNAVGSSPDYSDENLKTALANFAAALGNRYDGDSRVGYIQVGLLGFWGEWHTWTENSATHSWIPDATKTALIDAFDAAFETTQIQIRYPHWYAVGANQRQGLGLHDDSFAHSTIDEGVYGAPVDWFFWSQVQASAATDFWMSGAMGGEVRPELQATIFDDSYAAGTQYKQDFGQCAETTHATYMLNYHAFEESYSGNARDSARAASDQMGYAFRLAEVSVAEGSDGDTVDITATVIQDGIAPFYYDLSIELSCPDGFSGTVGGVDDIVSEGSTAAFTFTAVPATSTCLSSLGFSLSSSYALAGAPVKFAQGMSDGGVVEASLPLPPTALPTSQPTNVVTPSPTKAPTPLPTFSPTMPPTPVPTSPPSSLPTPLPTAMPTFPTTHAPTPMPTKPITPSPTKNPTTSPVVAHKTLVCGRGDVDGQPCAEGLTKTAPIDEMHEVRCCRDCTGINCKKPWKSKCATFDSNLYARSKVSRVCKVGTFVEAIQFCRNSANDETARLCTALEVENSCAKGTGCNFDKEQVWACAYDGHTCQSDAECCGSCVNGTCRGESSLFY